MNNKLRWAAFLIGVPLCFGPVIYGPFFQHYDDPVFKDIFNRVGWQPAMEYYIETYGPGYVWELTVLAMGGFSMAVLALFWRRPDNWAKGGKT